MTSVRAVASWTICIRVPAGGAGLTTIGLPQEMGALAVQLLMGGAKHGEHLIEMPVIIRNSIKRA